jgi:hypothetical protein
VAKIYYSEYKCFNPFHNGSICFKHVSLNNTSNEQNGERMWMVCGYTLHSDIKRHVHFEFDGETCVMDIIFFIDLPRTVHVWTVYGNSFNNHWLWYAVPNTDPQIPLQFEGRS